MDPQLITVETTIKSRLNVVWDCWTKAEHIVNWNFASDDWHCPKAENNPFPGGIFNYHMASKDGQMSFDFKGKHDEVVPMQKIVSYLDDDRKMIVEFKMDISSIRVTETFEAETDNPIEMQAQGWQSVLWNFKDYVENL